MTDLWRDVAFACRRLSRLNQSDEDLEDRNGVRLAVRAYDPPMQYRYL